MSVLRLVKLCDHLVKLHLSQRNMTAVASTLTHGNELMAVVKATVPVLSPIMHKGVCGRVGVVGGSKEYTGAPYFAAISALKAGADLSHVFCPEAAAPVIKSYSPDLIVHPILDRRDLMTEFQEKLKNLHALVVGPGLGRNLALLSTVKEIIDDAKQRQIPIVLDADGLFLILQDPSTIANYGNAILTPNRIEFERLYRKVLGKDAVKINAIDETIELASVMGVTIVQKGHEDIITDGTTVVLCQQQGSSRRCGGQGDLLSGSMGTLAYWAYRTFNQSPSIFSNWSPNIVAAYGACFLTRECNRLAYYKYKRSMVTENMIDYIQVAFEDNFEQKL